MLPIIVVVMVAAGEAADPATIALVQTAKRALEPGSTVLALETAMPASDRVAETMAETQRADAVVVLTWSGDRAALRVRSRTGEWSQRELEFAPVEPREERGRTLALLASSMLEGSRPTEPPPPPLVRTPPRAWEPWLVFEAGPSTAIGITAPPWSLGPAVLTSLRVTRLVWLHLGAQARFGPFDAAAADAVYVVVGPGAGVRVPLGSLWLGGRAELDLSVVSLARGASRGSRVMPGLTGMLEGGVFLGHVGVRAGAGLEGVFETTTIFSGDAAVGRIPTLRLRLEVGISFAF